MAYGLRLEAASVYGGGHRGQRRAILEGIDLAIAPGSFTALIGESGAGKSTALKSLGLRLPNRRRGDTGTLSLEHADGLSVVTPATHDQFLSLLAFVPQADLFVDELTAGETLAQACIYSGVERERSAELLRSVGLDRDTATKRVAQLSGGQKRRLSIARALASEPAILMLDEPTSGLDLPVAHDVMAMLRGLCTERKITIVCTSHQPSTLTVCDRVLVLAAGSADKGGHVAADYDTEGFAAALAAAPDGAKLYRAADTIAGLPLVGDATPFPATPEPGHWHPKHFRTTLRRNLLGWWRDGGARRITFLQPVALAIVVVLTQSLHGAEAPKFIDFFLAVSALWIGMSASVRGFVAERMLFAIDEIGGLTRGSYFAAKVTAAVLVSTIGVVALCLVAHLSVMVADGFFDLELARRQFGFAHLIPRLVVLGLAGVSGVTIGLLISALAPSESSAVALMPLALLPQVVFSRYACGFATEAENATGFPYQALEHGAAGAYSNPLEMLNYAISLPMTTRHSGWSLESIGRHGFDSTEFYWTDFGALGLLVALQCFAVFVAFSATSNRWLSLIR